MRSAPIQVGRSAPAVWAPAALLPVTTVLPAAACSGPTYGILTLPAGFKLVFAIVDRVAMDTGATGHPDPLGVRFSLLEVLLKVFEAVSLEMLDGRSQEVPAGLMK